MMNIATDQTDTMVLSYEAALAARVVRSGAIPREFFQWLSRPNTIRECDPALSDEAAKASMDNLFVPMLAHADEWEKEEARYAAAWFGGICRCAASHYIEMELGIGSRMLAACLLPLYRSLATGSTREGFEQARFRMSELLTLLALCHEIGEDLVRALDDSHSKQESPGEKLRRQFDLDLTRVAELVRLCADGYDAENNNFTEYCSHELRRFDHQDPPSTVPWAGSDLLWRLAGELISRKSELILPRSWVDTPVPWSSIGDHWHSLDHVLSLTVTAQSESSPGGFSHSSSIVAASDNRKDLRSAREIPASRSSAADGDDTSRIQPGPARVLAKFLIAEIRTHNDPIFVNVIGRQIAKCRAEDRSVSLASIVVEPENTSDHHQICGSRENGLAPWQQMLVNWLVDHPQVIEPYAFVTPLGELLLCLLDVERNETTALLRHGLVEVLTGKRVNEGSLLTKVNVPAHYHAGIASTSSPAASFMPVQLIEPAVRCLSAASRHGKACIKSIEVY